MSDHVLDVQPLAKAAVEAGADRPGLTAWRWDVSGRCLSPVYVERVGRPFRSLTKVYDSGYYLGAVPKLAESKWSSFSVSVELKVKCRKCAECRREHARLWARRAQSEVRASLRTWYCTFTARPSEHVKRLAVARVKMHKQGIDFETLPEAERIRLIDAEYQREFTLMFKRLRAAGARFRYILVMESVSNHQGGLPHYHALIHELGEPITYRQVRAQWSMGFTKIKLVREVDDGTSERAVAWYVCKYLSKGSDARVRASLRYGREPEKDEDEKTPLRHRRENHSKNDFRDVKLLPPSNDGEADPPKKQTGGSGGEDPRSAPADKTLFMVTDLKESEVDELSRAGLPNDWCPF